MKINKTALAAGASIAAVLVAGTAALAANFGLLEAGAGNEDLTATPQLVSTSTSTPVVAASQPTTTAVETLAYQVEGVGVVTLARSGDDLEVAAVDADGPWTWTVTDDGSDVVIRFTDGGTVIVFSADVEDGQVMVNVVDETPVVANGSSSDDDHEDDHDDHYEDDHEEHDDD
jgi:hypothetical protein